MAFFLSNERGERSLDVFQLMGKLVLSGKEQFEKDVKDTEKIGSKLATNIGKSLKTVAKVGAAAVGACATAVAALAKESLNSYAEYEQLVGGSQLLFGDAYDFIAEKAKTAYKDVQMSQNEYLQQVNGFAVGLKTSLGGNEQAAAELASKIIQAEADVVAATGNSQEAVQNAFNGIMKGNFTMLDNLQLGITPTKEGFQTLIEQVNDYNATLGKTTNYQIDNLADCQAALVDYIEMQGLSGYASNEAAGTIQGSLSMVKASWQNLLTGFADSSQDMDSLIENLVTSLTTAAHNIVPRLAQILSGISGAMAQIMPVICAELPGLLEALLPGIIEGAVVLVKGLIMALPMVLELLLSQVPFIISELASALIEVFPVLVETVIKLLGQIGSSIKEFFSNLGDYIKLPHIGISPSGWKIADLLKGSIPKLSIEWYAKAMNNPMLMNEPTIFGYNAKTGQLQAGGEAGSEVVAGTNTLMNMIGDAVESKTAAQNERIVSVLVSILNAILGGNAELLQVFMSDRTFTVGEREFARLVKQYA